MGHDALFSSGYRKPNFRLHAIIFITIIGVSVFLSTQVEKSKDKTRVEALKVPVPIDSVFVEENNKRSNPQVETPKIANASDPSLELEKEYRFEDGSSLDAINNMLAKVDEDSDQVDIAESKPAVDGLNYTVADNEDKLETASEGIDPETSEIKKSVVENQQPEREKDLAIMVTDDEVAASVSTAKVTDTEVKAKSQNSTSENSAKKVAKMDAVYELQQDRFLETLAKTANQDQKESLEVRRIKEAIQSDRPLKLQSTAKAKEQNQNKSTLVKVAATKTSGVLESKITTTAEKDVKNAKLVVAKKSKSLNNKVAKNKSNSAKKITLTRSELNNVLSQFTRSYNKGDIQRLLALFDENAVTNDQTSKLGIRKEYVDLFKSTSIRDIKLRNVRWNMADDKAKGNARFIVTVKQVGSSEAAQIEGNIEILAVKEDRGVFIKKLLHQVSGQ